MSKERHRYGVSGRGSAAPRRALIGPPEVGIIPGNRFFLLPLKKVSALVRHRDYRPCRDASATSTKTCIRSKPAPNRATTAASVTHTHKSTTLRSHAASSRLIVRQRRRQLAIAKTLLGPISETHEVEATTKPLLDDPGNAGLWHHGPTRADLNARRVSTHLYCRRAGHVSTGLVSRTKASTTSVFCLDRPSDDPVPKRGTRRPATPRTRSGAAEIRRSHVPEPVAGDGKAWLVALGRSRVSPSELPTAESTTQCRSGLRRGPFLCSLGRKDDLMPISRLRRDPLKERLLT